jgi:hypothetical protein
VIRQRNCAAALQVIETALSAAADRADTLCAR